MLSKENPLSGSSKRPPALLKKAVTWSGTLAYKKGDIKFQIPSTGFRINGPAVEEYLPNILKISQRMNCEELLLYLKKSMIHALVHELAFISRSRKSLKESTNHYLIISELLTEVGSSK